MFEKPADHVLRPFSYFQLGFFSAQAGSGAGAPGPVVHPGDGYVPQSAQTITLCSARPSGGASALLRSSLVNCFALELGAFFLPSDVSLGRFSWE